MDAEDKPAYSALRVSFRAKEINNKSVTYNTYSTSSCKIGVRPNDVDTAGFVRCSRETAELFCVM